jgi:hypothetical protein
MKTANNSFFSFESISICIASPVRMRLMCAYLASQLCSDEHNSYTPQEKCPNCTYVPPLNSRSLGFPQRSLVVFREIVRLLITTSQKYMNIETP